MHPSFFAKIRLFLARNRNNRILHKFVQFLCCVVVFVTTYALILPAITMEQTAFCGLEEHQHQDSCMQIIQENKLNCTLEKLGIHTHGSDCYDSERRLVCGQADYVIHSHDANCYDSTGVLVCAIPEKGAHTHTDTCYEVPEVPHVHTESCYTQERGELICTTTESEGHAHSADCYVRGDILECSITENHEHAEDCYSLPLTCTLSTEPHVHSDSCYGTGSLLCQIPEGHVHTDECVEVSLTCTLEDADHLHDDACFTTNIVCQIPENHSHTAECYQSILVCGKEEGQAHCHNEACYGTEAQLHCQMIEYHVHGDDCYNKEQICTLEEEPGHSHEDACYVWNPVLTCGKEEGDLEYGEPVQICTEPIANTHIHGDNCFDIIETKKLIVCQHTEADHVHTAACYACGLEEHTHTLACYSDPEADLETPAVWEATFADVELTGNWPEDLVAIAQTQLGYTESSRNYTVWEDGSTHGYTRYGAWYGVPHGDWCAMFVSFCLNYAGVEDMPYNYGVRPWIEDLTELGLYHTADSYTPKSGDLVFFDWEGDGLSDHVGIVAEVIEETDHTDAKIKTIEGNSSNAVRYVYYAPDDPVLLGYSTLPEILPNYFCGLEEHSHGEGCYDAEGNLTCTETEHTHSEACLTEPVIYYCGLEEHSHGEGCYDAEGNLTCTVTEHAHSEACLTAPVTYYCGLEEHSHGEGCYDADGNLTCTETEHAHSEACLTAPVTYYCGLEEHSHGESCYDEQGILICEKEEHLHDESCSQAPPEYLCGMEEHVHGDACRNEAGELVCQLPEHTHILGCTFPALYYCGLEAHSHSEACLDETGNLICGKEEHIHTEDCTKQTVYFCGLTAHTHVEGCYNEEGFLLCKIPEHVHKDSCYMHVTCYCGLAAHTHETSCYDADGTLICTVEAHTHNILCTADLRGLSDADRKDVETVILRIHEMPSADEIDAKIEAFEQAEDYEGEELWLTEIYQQIGEVYLSYSELGDTLQNYVVNRKKLLELEYIWSAMPLANVYVWLDGTNGGLMAFTGSSNELLSVNGRNSFSTGADITLPAEWDSPTKYEYSLNGWYDITTGKYYEPGAKLTIGTKPHVLYADWMAGTYNVGEPNENTVVSLNTNSFITTHVFDYSSIFNMYSTTYTGTVNRSGHSEKWDAIWFTEDETPVHGDSTLGFIFRDWDNGGVDLSYPIISADDDWNRSSTGSTGVTDGILDREEGTIVRNYLFNPSNSDGVLGKEYVGQGNYLYQFMEEGSYNYDDKHNGYYYYDSTKNAASYNQSQGRFYIYDYLERTSDSLKDGVPKNTAGAYSDFLPFNSPYANTNGKYQETYSAGNNLTNYQYDAKYNGESSASNRIGTNYWYGFSSAIDFYLPNPTRYEDSNGYGNQSTTGQDMTFEFSGDDDVWVFVDNKLVLDLGGMHDIVSGSINFSSGKVVCAGNESTISLPAGEHTLTIYYMERGASQANCMIYFNIAPRYTMQLQKVDNDDRQQLLNGAEFTVYTDPDCTQKAELWKSRADYEANLPSTSVFKVENGNAQLWGFSSGNTYYIKETKEPAGGYTLPKGVIKLHFSTTGESDYEVYLPMENDPDDGAEPTPGFSAFGFRYNSETEIASLVITNAMDPSKVTDVTVEKVWGGGTGLVHPKITVNLMDGDTVLQSAELNEENEWKYTWENLPKYRDDGSTEIQYTVKEDPVPGYTSKVETIQETDTETEQTDVISYRITNTPVKELTVKKLWDVGNYITDNIYKDLTVTVKLLADGVDTEKTVDLTADNDWSATFTDLPWYQSDGNTEIQYQLVEVISDAEENLIPLGDAWQAEYGEITQVEDSSYQFTVTITNTYSGMYQLPETGGIGTLVYTTAGTALTSAALVLLKRRKRK